MEGYQLLVAYSECWAFSVAGSTGLETKNLLNRLPTTQPEKTLQNRYARGEIDEEEYRRRRERLDATDEDISN
ncbi:SHOCT domain-containing protein [Halorubrum sp. CBA1125]|uniref:SHOCT domain-containing protein n=1 Tax=Halorubrum sp. CBA1125 TaxID=2668072 RepID=UPI001E5F8A07|nr:SHOCT domain-containing protein [Halorubrum sp. CBA1125]